MHHIYHLIDPRDHAVRYVGKSTNPRSRFRSHIKESIERQNTEKKRWIHQLLGQGLQPVLAIVASYATEPPARQRESAECHQHRATIYNLHDPAKGAGDMRERTDHEKQSSPRKKQKTNKNNLDTKVIP